MEEGNRTTIELDITVEQKNDEYIAICAQTGIITTALTEDTALDRQVYWNEFLISSEKGNGPEEFEKWMRLRGLTVASDVL